jgi:drug/metabolite transporter (DMT)-like permease
MGHHKRLLLARGLLFAVSSVLGIYALKQLPLRTSRVLSMTSPIFTALFAYLFLGERLNILHTIAIAGSFCGVILVLSPSPDQPIEWLAATLALLGSAVAALAFVTTRRLADESAAVLLQYMGGAGAAVAAAVSALAEAPVLPDAAQATLFAAVCLAGLAAQIAFNEGLQLAKAGLVSGLQYTQARAALTPYLRHCLCLCFSALPHPPLTLTLTAASARRPSPIPNPPRVSSPVRPLQPPFPLSLSFHQTAV